jgi:hypothetical protein
MTPPLESRNPTEITWEFNRKQFNFIGKIQETEKITIPKEA